MIDFFYQVVTPAWSTHVITTGRVSTWGPPTNVTVLRVLWGNTVRRVRKHNW